VPASGRFTFAAAVGVIHGIHGYAADLGTVSQPTRPPGLADYNVNVFFVADGADGRAAVALYAAHFAGGEAQHDKASFLSQ